MDSLMLVKLSVLMIGIAKVLGVTAMLCIVFSCTHKSMEKARPMIDLGILAAIASGVCFSIDKYLI